MHFGDPRVQWTPWFGLPCTAASIEVLQPGETIWRHVLNVSMGVPNDGTGYAATTQLDLQSEQQTVNVANGGFRH